MLVREPRQPTSRQRLLQACRNARMLVASCEKQYAAGDKGALLLAINWCVGAGIRVPKWAADAYQKKYRATVWEFRHGSWDEVRQAPPT
jgi:hypothetical protein